MAIIIVVVVVDVVVLAVDVLVAVEAGWSVVAGVR